MNPISRFSALAALLLPLAAAAQPAPQVAKAKPYPVLIRNYNFGNFAKSKADFADFAAKQAEGWDERFSPASLAGEGPYAFLAVANNGGLLLAVRADGAKLGDDGFPGGSLEVQIRTSARNTPVGDAPVLLRLDLDVPEPEPVRRAPNPAWWLYHLERRFSHRQPAFLAYTPGTPGLFFPAMKNTSHAFLRRPEGGWHALFHIPFSDLYGHAWPMCVAGQADMWRVRVARRASDGSVAIWGGVGDNPGEEGRILWPKGSQKGFEDLCHAMSQEITKIGERYTGEVQRQRTIWQAAERERHFYFPKTKEPTYHRFDRASDNLFFNHVFGALLKENENLAKAVAPAKEKAQTPVFSYPDSVRPKILRGMGRMIYFDELVDACRRDYLRNQLLGRAVTPPDPALAEAARRKARADELDPTVAGDNAGEGAIQLDDIEF